MIPYDVDLKPFEEKLEFAKQEVDEEITLASEQSNRELQLIVHENKQYISDRLDEVKNGGALQRIEARLFRIKQSEELARIRRLQIAMMAKEEGRESFITTSFAGFADV